MIIPMAQEIRERITRRRVWTQRQWLTWSAQTQKAAQPRKKLCFCVSLSREQLICKCYSFCFSSASRHLFLSPTLFFTRRILVHSRANGHEVIRLSWGLGYCSRVALANETVASTRKRHFTALSSFHPWLIVNRSCLWFGRFVSILNHFRCIVV